MLKSKPLYPNPIHQYAIQQLFSDNSFECVGDYGYRSDNCLMTWWTHQDQNKPLAQHAKLFGFYEVIKKLFAEAEHNPNPTDRCYNINYVRNNVMLPMDYLGNFLLLSESNSEVEMEVNTVSMIFTPAHTDFVPMLVTVFSNDPEDKAYTAIDDISVYTSMIMRPYYEQTQN
jgi:hypothetical protein